MVTPSGTKTLDSLIRFLDHLTGRATPEALRTHLSKLDITPDDVAQYARFSERHYARNLICGGRWYHLLVLCWRSGQRSPIHNHAGSTCGLKVLTGVATETRFDITPCSLIKPESSRELVAGTVGVSQDRDIHQVSNLAAPGQDLVTIHIYSPPLLRMDTYSLTDPTIGRFTPMILEHVHGSGI